jgi:hypothetical protein
VHKIFAEKKLFAKTPGIPRKTAAGQQGEQAP